MKLSRSKIQLFLDCPRCFYFDRKLGVARPPSLPFNLNLAVDQLLKNEFNIYRRERRPHPLMERDHIDAIPFSHPELDVWRENFQGIQVLHEETNLLITGAVDDIWERPDGTLIVVDYKATSKREPITKTSQLHPAYQRQMEVYQWLLRKKGFKVDTKSYFVYCNGVQNKEQFNRHLEFEVAVVPYEAKCDWIESTLFDIFETINSPTLPSSSEECHYCKYVRAVQAHSPLQA